MFLDRRWRAQILHEMSESTYVERSDHTLMLALQPADNTKTKITRNAFDIVDPGVLHTLITGCTVCIEQLFFEPFAWARSMRRYVGQRP